MDRFLTVPIVASVLFACSASSPTAFAGSSKLTQSFNDTIFELKACELSADRTATCKMTVRNQYTDKRIEITRSGIAIQDDLGNENTYNTGMSLTVVTEDVIGMK